MQTLSIIGAGRLGRSLGRLAVLSGRYRIAAVCCRASSHADEAVAFIGAGSALSLAQLPPLEDLVLLAVPDAALAQTARMLADVVGVRAGCLVFHASGACDSRLLAPLAEQGAATGSLHPAFSFAEPARAVAGFAGTRCALEGEPAALKQLAAFAAAIGGVPFELAPGGKAAYHAALSIASNYLVTVTDLAYRAAAFAGLDRTAAGALIAPLMRQTLDNALTLGPGPALTGPIVRGDAGTVAGHLQTLATDPALAECYRALGRATLQLAAPQLTPAQQAALAALLSDPSAR